MKMPSTTSHALLAVFLFLGSISTSYSAATVVDFGVITPSTPVVTFTFEQHGVLISAVDQGGGENHFDLRGFGDADGEARLHTGNDGADINAETLQISIVSGGTFDLLSLDVEFLTDAWQIESSTGAIQPLTVGTVSLSGSGWENISSATVTFTGPRPASFGEVRLDNITLTNVIPEPSHVLCLLVGLGLTVLRRHRCLPA